MTRLLAGVLLLAMPLQAAELVDDEGTRLSIDSSTPTVVALAPHLAEIVFEIGAGEQLVGTIEWSNYPDAARRVPRVGDAFRVDYERVVAMQPDIVLAWGGGTPSEVIERLRQFGLVVAVLEPTTLESIAAQVRWLGHALGHVEKADAVASAFIAGLEELRARHAAAEEVSVFYQISSQPLFTVNGDHPISEMIRLCGGRNVFADLELLAPAVTLEAVIGRNPDAIVMGRHAEENGSLQRWQRWPDVTAVASGNLLMVDGELLARSTPRMLEGGRRLCDALEGARLRLEK